MAGFGVVGLEADDHFYLLFAVQVRGACAFHRILKMVGTLLLAREMGNRDYRGNEGREIWRDEERKMGWEDD